MTKRVPQYLKEISTSQSGPEQGNNPREWDFAHNPYSHEEYSRGSSEWSANYLGWWDRNGRGVYYFGENQRPKYFRDPESYYWDAYDWYRKTAGAINQAFDNEQKVLSALLKKTDLFSQKELKRDTPYLPTYYVPEISVPSNIRNIKGIAAWLRNKYNSTEIYLKEYNKKAREFNHAIDTLNRDYYRQKTIELENQKKAAEASKYNNIITHLDDLRNEVSKLAFDVRNIKADKDKDFSLFKSELVSEIPDTNLNVSRIEYDEDIAQLNETLNGIKKNIYEKAKKNGDSICELQKKVNVSINKSSILTAEVAGAKNSISKLIEGSKNMKSRVDTIQKQDLTIRETQFKEIYDLRKNLQALGGETREFIDNTKRREMASNAKVAKKESVVTRVVKKAAFPDLTKRPWLRESVTGRFFQLANQW